MADLSEATMAALSRSDSPDEALNFLRLEHQRILDLERMGMPGAKKLRGLIEELYHALQHEDFDVVQASWRRLSKRSPFN